MPLAQSWAMNGAESIRAQIHPPPDVHCLEISPRLRGRRNRIPRIAHTLHLFTPFLAELGALEPKSERFQHPAPAAVPLPDPRRQTPGAQWPARAVGRLLGMARVSADRLHTRIGLTGTPVMRPRPPGRESNWPPPGQSPFSASTGIRATVSSRTAGTASSSQASRACSASPPRCAVMANGSLRNSGAACWRFTGMANQSTPNVSRGRSRHRSLTTCAASRFSDAIGCRFPARVGAFLSKMPHGCYAFDIKQRRCCRSRLGREDCSDPVARLMVPRRPMV